MEKARSLMAHAQRFSASMAQQRREGGSGGGGGGGDGVADGEAAAFQSYVLSLGEARSVRL